MIPPLRSTHVRSSSFAAYFIYIFNYFPRNLAHLPGSLFSWFQLVKFSPNGFCSLVKNKLPRFYLWFFSNFQFIFSSTKLNKPFRNFAVPKRDSENGNLQDKNREKEEERHIFLKIIWHSKVL